MHKNENNSKGPTNGRFGRPRGYMLIVYDLKLATRQKIWRLFILIGAIYRRKFFINYI